MQTWLQFNRHAPDNNGGVYHHHTQDNVSPPDPNRPSWSSFSRSKSTPLSISYFVKIHVEHRVFQPEDPTFVPQYISIIPPSTFIFPSPLQTSKSMHVVHRHSKRQDQLCPSTPSLYKIHIVHHSSFLEILIITPPSSGSIFSLTLLPSKSMLISKLQDTCYNPFPPQNTCCS